MEKHVHDWKRDSSTFEVKLVNLSIPPKKYLDYIKRQSLLIFVSCAPVGEFSVTCTCSHVQYANSALVSSKTDTTVHKAYQLSLSRVFFFSSWSIFSLCAEFAIDWSLYAAQWTPDCEYRLFFVRIRAHHRLVHCYLCLSTKLITSLK